MALMSVKRYLTQMEEEAAYRKVGARHKSG